jgi:hypothetical protein
MQIGSVHILVSTVAEANHIVYWNGNFLAINPTSWETIQRYARMPASTAPPIVVSSHLEISDGFHRLRAAMVRGDLYVSAIIA